jgi:DNA-binding NarL/FixJ family response regulator
MVRGRRMRWHTSRMLLQCVIVDDNEPFLKVARRMLEREGMAVVGVAANGAEALRQARELRPDVALVDISLGAESGFDVGRQITPHVRSVILISSHDADDYAELIADSPAVGFLSKAELSADAIRRLLT